MDPFLQAAIDEAKLGYHEGGIPVGSVLVRQGLILGRGHNRRIQDGNPVLHGELDAIQNAGRLPLHIYHECTLYTTLSPCMLTCGAILFFGISRVIIGDNQTCPGEVEFLQSRGVEVVIKDEPQCIDLMKKYIAGSPDAWDEDVKLEERIVRFRR
jgi:cytosine/creatinine deaminase